MGADGDVVACGGSSLMPTGQYERAYHNAAIVTDSRDHVPRPVDTQYRRSTAGEGGFGIDLAWNTFVRRTLTP